MLLALHNRSHWDVILKTEHWNQRLSGGWTRQRPGSTTNLLLTNFFRTCRKRTNQHFFHQEADRKTPHIQDKCQTKFSERTPFQYFFLLLMCFCRDLFHFQMFISAISLSASVFLTERSESLCLLHIITLKRARLDFAIHQMEDDAAKDQHNSEKLPKKRSWQQLSSCKKHNSWRHNCSSKTSTSFPLLPVLIRNLLGRNYNHDVAPNK